MLTDVELKTTKRTYQQALNYQKWCRDNTGNFVVKVERSFDHYILITKSGREVIMGLDWDPKRLVLVRL